MTPAPPSLGTISAGRAATLVPGCSWRLLAPAFALILAAAACSGADDEAADTETAETTTTTSAPEAERETTEPETQEPDTIEAATAETEETEPEAAEPSSEASDATADRPYDVFVPSSYDAEVATPLILLLHGYTGTGDSQESYFEFESLAESRGFLYVHPDGTVDGQGAQFWNATDACCAFFPEPPDDAAYLVAIIDEVSAAYNVDPKAIFLAGHSNGGFMSYRMACDHADRIAAVASLAGAAPTDADSCSPSEPVSVLQIHGTDDSTILYDGGVILDNPYPSAAETVERWVDVNTCPTTPTTSADALDLVEEIDGADSDIEAFSLCEQDTTVQLWTIDGGSHVPDVTEEFSASVVDFLLAHPKP